MKNGETENKQSKLMQPTNKLAQSRTVYKRDTHIYVYTFEKTDNIF